MNSIGYAEQDLLEIKTFVDYELLDNLLLLISDRTRSAFIGIEFGVTKNVLSGHLLDSLIRSCDRVFDIIRKIEVYNAILSDFVYIKATERKDEFRADFMVAEDWIRQYPVSSRIVRDFILSFFYQIIKEQSNGYSSPNKILINNRPHVASIEELRRRLCFTGDIFFSHDFDFLVYNKSQDVQMISSNADVRDALESRIFQYSASIGTTKRLSCRIKAQLIEIGDNILNITIEHMASLNHISVRRLQQVLREEKTGFREITDDVKLIVIKKLLIDHGLSSKEVADQLGYANPESLYSFFKKMTGHTPGEFHQMFPATFDSRLPRTCF